VHVPVPDSPVTAHAIELLLNEIVTLASAAQEFTKYAVCVWGIIEEWAMPPERITDQLDGCYWEGIDHFSSSIKDAIQDIGVEYESAGLAREARSLVQGLAQHLERARKTFDFDPLYVYALNAVDTLVGA